VTATPRRVQVLGNLFHGQVPAGAVYVGRSAPGLTGSPYANPHRVGHCQRCDTRHDQIGAVDAYTCDFVEQPDWVAAVRRDLAGRDLACWCPLTDGEGRPVPCHADVLLGIANG
jgi:hypothetical protein